MSFPFVFFFSLMIKDFQIRPSCAGIRDTDEIDERSEATTQLLFACIALFLFFGASLEEAKGKKESRVLRLMADAKMAERSISEFDPGA